MSQLRRLIRADIIKLRSTQLVWMHLYIPLMGLIIFISYYSYTAWDSLEKIGVYLQVLAIVFPILIGIITSIVAEQEYMAGRFQNILISSDKKGLALVSKLILILALGTLSTMLAAIGFYIGFSFIENKILPLTMYLSIIVVLVASNIFLYMLHLFLSLRFSKEISIGFGILGSFISALFRTGMGDGRWPFVPSAWGIRFVGTVFVEYQNSGNAFRDPDLKLGFTICIITSFLSFIIMLLWFIRWEGNRYEG